MATFYASDRDVPKDEAEAVRWYQKAADQGHAYAQNNLGVCYANGQGVLKNEAEAVKWYSKAANQNHASAQYNLGGCYANGDGVAKDYVMGYKWVLLAAGQGEEHAKKLVTILEEGMTREQIAEGQKLARNFKASEATSGGPHSSRTGMAEIRARTIPAPASSSRRMGISSPMNM